MQTQSLETGLVNAEQNFNKIEFKIKLVSSLRPALKKYI
jgi:hypothetical protein